MKTNKHTTHIQYLAEKNTPDLSNNNSQNNSFFENYAPSEYTDSYRIIRTPSTFAKSTLFYIQEIGKLKSLKSHISKRKSLDSYLYIIVQSGTGTFTHENDTYTVKRGDHIFIDCQRPYSHMSSDHDPWELLWVHFNGLLMKNYFELYYSKNITPLFKPNDSLNITKILETLMTLASNEGTQYELISSNLLNNLITIILTRQNTSLGKIPSNIPEKMKQMKDFIDNNFQKKIHLDMMVEDFYISKYHMSREFKKAFGITISNYIVAKRITNAKELLRFSDMRVDEIGRLCGIDDNSYFNKVFQKYEGMSATKYRKKWRGLD